VKPRYVDEAIVVAVPHTTENAGKVNVPNPIPKFSVSVSRNAMPARRSVAAATVEMIRAAGPERFGNIGESN